MQLSNNNNIINSTISNSPGGIIVEQSNITINASTFTYLGNSQVEGGAI